MPKHFDEPIILTFPHSKEDLRRIRVNDETGEYDLYRISPKVADWPAMDVPDGVNPRSHDQECLTGKVAADIERTLREDPQDFWLANRGGFMLAEKVRFAPDRGVLSIRLSDPDLHGLADGATTNAVIAKLLALRGKPGGEGLDEALATARFNLDVVVGLTDRDRIGKLVQGRNRSVQVKEWSLADFRGGFDWLKEAVERRGSPLRGRIGWEENSSAEVSVLDLISVLTLFHPVYESSGGRRAPNAAFSSKGTADKRLLDEGMAEGFQSLAPVLQDIVDLHDYVHANFEKAYNEFNRRGNGKPGRLDLRKKAGKHRQTTLYFTGAVCDYQPDKGMVFPLLAALRCLLFFGNGKASWRTSPFDFFDAHGPDLVDRLFAEYDKLGKNPAAVGKNRSVYETLYEKAQNLLMMRLLAAAE